MKPLRLKMYGIGPYAKEVEVDFDRLNEDGLFLITGATGAGKTSIFDGITYALYGETNFGDKEKTNGIICDYLDVEDHKHSYVEFTFEVDNIEYTVKRTPAYYSYKKSGERNKTKIGEKFEIETDDKKNIPGKKEDRDKYIKDEILKVDLSQFKKLIMLPQGAFNEFIRSNSESKKKTLEKIFDTNIYKFITDKLSSKVDELKDQRDEIENNIFSELKTLSIDGKRWNELLKNKILNLDELLNIIKDKRSILELENKVIENNIKEINIDKIIGEFAKGENNNKSIDKLNKAKEKLEKLDKESKNIKDKENELKIFKLANEIKVEYANKVRSIEDYNKKDGEYKISFEELEEYTKKNTQKIESLDSLTKKLTTLKDRISTLDLLKDDIKRYEQLLKTIDTNKGLLKMKEEKIIENLSLETTALSKQKTLKIKKDKIEKDIERGIKLALEQEETKNRETILKNLVETFDNILKEENIIEEKKEKLKNLILEENKKFEIYREQTNLWFQNEAYNLVGQLKVGKPCPVCGSIDHPSKAEKPDGAPLEEELKEYEESYKEIGSKKDILTGDITSSENNITKQKKDLEKKLLDEGLEDNYKKLLEVKKENKDKIKKIKAELKILSKPKDLKILEEEERLNTEDIEKINIKKQELKDRIIILKKDLEYDEKEWESLKIKLEKNNITIDTFDEDYTKVVGEKQSTELEKIEIERLKIERENKKTTLEEKFKNLQELKIYMEKSNILFEQKLKDMNFSSEDEYIKAQSIKGKEIEKEIISHKEDLASVKTIIKENKDYEGIDLVDLKELENKVKISRDKIKELDNELSKNIFEISQLDIKQKNLKDTHKGLEKELKTFNIYAKLLGISKGEYGDQKNKVTFQNYVLGVYFEEVLDRANERFTKMTNNQYEMRIDRSKKGNARSGLDINVFDSHTGKERSIKTLSGGETFKASMALALGLSDVVQGQNGGIQLDSVFIDEGFGTLDEESLSTAMDILMELKSNGRTVGIISHVNELKQTINSQIRVIKTSRGSDIEVVF